MPTNGTGLREKVNFEVNVPQALILEHDDGVPSQGRFGDQYMYTFAGQKIAWVDPEVRDLILRARAGAGDQIAVCKREARDGHRKRVLWEVEKIEEEPPAPPTQPPAPHASTMRPAPANGSAPEAHQAIAPATGAPASGPAGLLTVAYRASIDAAIDATAYASQRGLKLALDAGDIRAAAISLFIHLSGRSTAAL